MIHSKYTFPFLTAFFLLGCSKDDSTSKDVAYGICYNSDLTHTVPLNFVEVDLNSGNVTKRADVSAFERLGHNGFHAYSKSENLYLYDINPLTIGVINTKSLDIKKIVLSEDTTIGGMRSMLLDDFNKKIFVIAPTYAISKQPILCVIPINLITGEIESKIEITSPNDTLTAYLCDIDSKNNKIYIKQKFGPKTYIFDYNYNKTTTMSVSPEFINLNYDTETNSLFGAVIHLNEGVYVESYFLDSGEIRKILLKDVSGVMNDCSVFNRNTRIFWQGVVSKSGHYKIDILKIDLGSGNIVQKVTLSEPVKGIN